MSRDGLMDDLTYWRQAPEPIVPGTLVQPHRNTDAPFNRTQALAMLLAAANDGFYIDKLNAARIHHCLTVEKPTLPWRQVCYGSHLGEWAFLHADGWRGGYLTQREAMDACIAHRSKA